MKIYRNCLTESLCDECINEFNSIKGEKVWGVSSMFWEPGLKVGVVGDCISTVLNENLSKKVENKLQKILPEYDSLLIQLYCWLPNSAISIHDDRDYKFGATLYLNRDWNANWGGIFLWQENDYDIENGLFSGFTPSYNTIVINDSKQKHMITPISPKCDESRLTIQIWGK